MIEALLSLITATALLLGSPGPAPLALAAIGATYGVRKGLSFLIGILAGLACAIVGAVVGLSALFTAFPSVKFACQLIGGAYIVYIAFKIACAPIVENTAPQSPPTFNDGFILNLLNPKAYAAFLAIFSQFLLPMTSEVTAYVATGVVCWLVAMIVDVIWLGFGALLKPIFAHPQQARFIRIIFALLMVSAVVFALI
ncbi:MAG: LysE family translocator [Psychrobium sp.]